MGDLVKNYDFVGINKAFDTKAFGEALEEGSAKAGRQSKWTKKTTFAPSGIYGSGQCPRYWYYAFHGAHFNYSATARERANMDSGSVAGGRIANLFESAEILKGTEVPVNHQDPPIGGFIDAMVEWQNEEMVVEVKTTRQEAWVFRQNSMKAPGYQLIQLLVYMEVMKKDKGFFVIENKNTHELLVIPVKMTSQNKALVDATFEWMRKVKKNSDNNLLPHRPFTRKSKECQSCPVWSTCWEGYVNKKKDPSPGVVDLPPLVVPK